MEFDLTDVKGIEDLTDKQYQQLVNVLKNIEYDERYNYRLGLDGFDFLYYEYQGEIILW